MQEEQVGMTIPQMVEDVRVGRMSRRCLIIALTALGISTGGVGAIVAAAAQQQSSEAIPHVQQNDNAQQHIQLHKQHIAYQSQGDTGALHNDYAEHAVVEDSMYSESLVGRRAIMERKGMGMAAIPDLQITITNRVAHGNQVSAEWVATGTHSGDPPAGETVHLCKRRFSASTPLLAPPRTSSTSSLMVVSAPASGVLCPSIPAIALSISRPATAAHALSLKQTASPWLN